MFGPWARLTLPPDIASRNFERSFLTFLRKTPALYSPRASTLAISRVASSSPGLSFSALA